MKKIIFMAVAALMAISANAQETFKKVRLYKGSEVVAEQNYNEIDSIVFVDVEAPSAPEGGLVGKFSVAEGKQVQFSQGNLQYQASTDTWRFAENQWDMIGADNKNISSTYSGWIDLFGWGTGNNPTNTSTDNTDYSTFSDWGVNAISNGGNTANQWRTLTLDEWNYLFNTRTNADQLKGQATVSDVHGYIFLPDDWTTPAGITFTASPNNWTTNVYTAADWTKMDAVGAVLLPAAGLRYGTDVFSVGRYGQYWSSSAGNESTADFVYFSEYYASAGNEGNRDNGLSVRLVQDCE